MSNKGGGASSSSSSLLADLINNNEQLKLDLNLLDTANNKSSSSLKNKTIASLASTSNAASTSDSSANKNKAWYDLFAELDPIKNPDTLGKENDKDERNC
jgi:hypothetical protein